MKTLSESIIGRKGAYRKDIIPKSFYDLEYGDFVEISGDLEGAFLYIPQHIANNLFNAKGDMGDVFVRYSDFLWAGLFKSFFPYNYIREAKIERIIRSTDEDEYKNLKTRNDVSRLFKKYNIPCE